MDTYRGGDEAAAQALDDDPFWSVVRRRHPDLTVVLLPEAEAGAGAGEPPPAIPPDELDHHLARLSTAWALLAPLLTEAATTPTSPPSPPSVRWASRTRPDGVALVAERSLTGLGPDGGTDLLRRVAWRLGAHEWRMVATTDNDGRPVLRASDGVLHLEAEAGAVVTVLALSTPTLQVPDDASRRVVRAALLDRLSRPAHPADPASAAGPAETDPPPTGEA
ncbi:hypothetical protein [Pimelobacter simplex]|uniref:hypothetical protein n=1 Tax=Nocardioides simplex TaxID=2045 RepID=UPI00215021C8|nr:hypothetical protein [Pimelobacter simplex]UUW89730.1 hypothetical protein M0M43_28985 [Pimelobacter simplex]UUW93559.1 hypothetical protein M0M48_17640 [Pimelobacter simplex]